MKLNVTMCVATVLLSGLVACVVKAPPGTSSEPTATPTEAAPAIECEAQGEAGIAPSESVIECEFRYAWHAIHGANGEKGYGWVLETIQLGGVTSDEAAHTAKASVKFVYRFSGRSVTKTGEFTFRKFGGKWEIDDREGENISSSTRFQMTP